MIQETLCQRISKVILEIIEQLLDFLAIDVDETLEKLFANDENAEKVIILLTAVNERRTINIVSKMTA